MKYNMLLMRFCTLTVLLMSTCSGQAADAEAAVEGRGTAPRAAAGHHARLAYDHNKLLMPTDPNNPTHWIATTFDQEHAKVVQSSAKPTDPLTSEQVARVNVAFNQRLAAASDDEVQAAPLFTLLPLSDESLQHLLPRLPSESLAAVIDIRGEKNPEFVTKMVQLVSPDQAYDLLRIIAKDNARRKRNITDVSEAESLQQIIKGTYQSNGGEMFAYSRRDLQALLVKAQKSVKMPDTQTLAAEVIASAKAHDTQTAEAKKPWHQKMLETVKNRLNSASEYVKNKIDNITKDPVKQRGDWTDQARTDITEQIRQNPIEYGTTKLKLMTPEGKTLTFEGQQDDKFTFNASGSPEPVTYTKQDLDNSVINHDLAETLKKAHRKSIKNLNVQSLVQLSPAHLKIILPELTPGQIAAMKNSGGYKFPPDLIKDLSPAQKKAFEGAPQVSLPLRVGGVPIFDATSRAAPAGAVDAEAAAARVPKARSRAASVSSSDSDDDNDGIAGAETAAAGDDGAIHAFGVTDADLRYAGA